MTKLVDISQLGIREVQRVEMHEVLDPISGTKQMEASTAVGHEAQPILTPEEASVLADEVWKPCPDHFKQYGAFMCKTGGRRFFCSVDPSAKKPEPEEHKTTSRRKRNASDD